MIVADSSAVIEMLLNTANGAAIADYLLDPGETIHVPHLMDVEVLQVLRRYARTAVISPVRAREAIEDYTDLPLHRYPHHVVLSRIWELRHNLSAYDAVYIALAEALDAPLFTCDRALASHSGHRAKVLVF